MLSEYKESRRQSNADRDHEESSNVGKNFGNDHPKINMENTTSKITARRQIFTQNNGNRKMEIAQKLVVAAKPLFQESEIKTSLYE